MDFYKKNLHPRLNYPGNPVDQIGSASKGAAETMKKGKESGIVHDKLYRKNPISGF